MNLHIITTIAVISLFPSPAPHETGIKAPSYSQVKEIQIDLQTLSTLDLAPYPYLPMGSRPNLYTPANCTWGAASMKPSIPENWGNAADWAYHASLEGYTVSDTPLIGAVAQHGGGYGHVGVVVDIRPGEILLTEMNYDWNGSVRTTWQPSSLYRYIYI